MNHFVFNFANVISFKSVLTSNIYYFYYDIRLSLHFANIINKSSLVIIFWFSFGHGIV